MRLRCANCRKTLLGEDRTSTSRVYGTHGACTLCESCTQRENKLIEEKGTNHVPELWTLYFEDRRTTERSNPTKEST